MSSDGPGWLLVAFWRSCLIVEFLWTCFLESVVGVSRELLLDLEPGDCWLPFHLFFGVYYWGLAGAIA